MLATREIHNVPERAGESDGVIEHFGTMYGLMQQFQAGFMLIWLCFMGMLSNPCKRMKMYVLNKI